VRRRRRDRILKMMVLLAFGTVGRTPVQFWACRGTVPGAGGFSL